MTKNNVKTLIAGLIIGATLVGFAMTPAPAPQHSTEQVVLGHRIDSLGNSQLVYATK